MSKAQKTILLLGGARHQVPAIKAARGLGLRTVLCDYLPDNPGQFEADVFYQLSTTDREAMLRVARDEGVDGVLAFGTDVALPSAGYVSEQLGLASNTLESIEVLSDKHLFRAALERLGLPCPGFVSLQGQMPFDEAKQLVDGLRYPIIVKPTDSSGSKGVTVLQTSDSEALRTALVHAAEYNRNGTLVAEEFIHRTEPLIVGGDICVQHGEIVFWGLMQAIRDEAVGGLVPVGEAYPAQLDAALMGRIRADLQRLVSGLGLRFGEMNVEVLVGPDDTPYIIELAGRAGGNMIPTQLSDASGIDLVEANVRMAMGDNSLDLHFDGADAAYATFMLHSAVEGSLVGVTYDEAVRKHLYREELFVAPGDHVEALVNSSQNVGIAFLRFDDPNEMWEMLPQINDLVQVHVS